jgi:hypothetical protein
MNNFLLFEHQQCSSCPKTLSVFECSEFLPDHNSQFIRADDLSLFEAPQESFWVKYVDPDIVQGMVVPLSILIVVIYQLYCKGSASKPKKEVDLGKLSKAEREKEIKQRFDQLQSKLNQVQSLGEGRH